jgi:hypothetical protein
MSWTCLIFRWIQSPSFKLCSHNAETSRSIKVGEIIVRVIDKGPLSDIKAIQTNSVALSPQANYTDWATATCRRNLVSTFVDRGVSRGQHGGSPTIVNLSFLDRSR